MKVLILMHIIFALFSFYISIAVGTEVAEVKPAEMVGKLFCVQPAKTYCLNVVDYPREHLAKMIRGPLAVHNFDA